VGCLLHGVRRCARTKLLAVKRLPKIKELHANLRHRASPPCPSAQRTQGRLQAPAAGDPAPQHRDLQPQERHHGACHQGELRAARQAGHVGFLPCTIISKAHLLHPCTFAGWAHGWSGHFSPRVSVPVGAHAAQGPGTQEGAERMCKRAAISHSRCRRSTRPSPSSLLTLLPCTRPTQPACSKHRQEKG